MTYSSSSVRELHLVFSLTMIKGPWKHSPNTLGNRVSEATQISMHIYWDSVCVIRLGLVELQWSGNRSSGFVVSVQA